MSENYLMEIGKILPYDKSLMECKIGNCPVEVFKPQSTYFKSLNENICVYEENIKRNEENIALYRKSNEYINQHFNERYEAEEQRILNEIDDIKLTYEDPSEFIGEKERQLDNLPQVINEILRNEFYKLNHLYKGIDEELYERNLDIKRELENTINDLVEWKEYCLEKAKKEEEKIMIEYLKCPHSNDDVIRHLQEFVREKINNEYTIILDEYYSMYEGKFNEISRNKYTKTIKCVFKDQSSIKVIKAFSNHNKLLQNKLNCIISQIQFNKEDLALDLIEKTLKGSFNKFIGDHFTMIYEFLYKNIKTIADSSAEFENSIAIKNYAQSIVKQINETMINNLPQFLEERFNDYIETFMEKIGVRTNDHQETVKVITMSMGSFLLTIPEGEIEINELVKMYNNYFGSNLNSVGFSKIKGVRELFNKKSRKEKGKYLTYYIKI